MNKYEMTEYIYSKVANKTLSEGCIIQTRENSCDICSPGEYCGHKQYFWKGSMGYDETIWFDRGRIKLEDGISYGEWFGYKIIGHPVYIGNILQYILSKQGSFFFNNHPIEEVCSLLEGNGKDDKIFWNDFTKPINEQSEECIKYVYDLITSTENK